MTIQRFQGLVLKIGNQTYVRHYYWLNYPLDPQEMGIQFPEIDKRGKLRLNPARTRKTPDFLKEELIEEGFVQRNDGMWSIRRTEEPENPENIQLDITTKNPADPETGNQPLAVESSQRVSQNSEKV